MTPFWISQILVGVAFCFDLASFQFRDRKSILICFVISATFIASHFLVLGKTTAGLIIFVSVARFTTSYFTTDARWRYVLYAAAALILVFTYESWISILAFIASLLATYASFHPNDKILRQVMMAATSVWLTHNILIGSPGAVLLESFFLASNFLGYYRFYIRPRKPIANM